MAIFLEFLPVIAFFVALKFTDVFVATTVAIVVTVAALVHQRVTTGRVQTGTLVSGALMVVFGGLTLALHDEWFVKWKPTVLMALFAVAFVISRFVGERPFAQRLLGRAFEAPRAAWLRVNDGLTAFFLAVGGVNLVVAYNFSTDTWATFKLFGLLGLNCVAIRAASAYLAKRGRILEQPSKS